MTSPAALEISGLSKTFSGQLVLDSVDVSVADREIHALVGQNGSGKSTLIKVLAGFHQPDPGAAASVRGRPRVLGSATAAHDSGIRFVHQDLGLILELSVIENLMLGRSYPTSFRVRIKWREAERIAAEIVARVGLDVDVTRPVGELGLAERTAVAIARALPERDEASLLVLDEPTAALPEDDVQKLFAIIRTLRDAGNSIVIVSHHLDEVLDLADTISVLRDGRKVAATKVSDVDHDGLGRLIVGHDLVLTGGRAVAVETAGRPVLDLQNVRGGTVAELTMNVAAGEIVGIAGLTGSGREIIAAMISGRVPRDGEVSVDGASVAPANPRAAIATQLVSVPGERARYGTFPNLTVRQNLTVGSLRRHMRRGCISGRDERAEVRRWVERFGIVTRGVDAPITSLSGGNQQKVLVARAMRLFPKVLVLDDPTAGIDVKARDQVHRIIAESAELGTAVLLVSTDSDELARVCDRVMVMTRGRVSRQLQRSVDLTREAIDHAQVAVVPS